MYMLHYVTSTVDCAKKTALFSHQPLHIPCPWFESPVLIKFFSATKSCTSSDFWALSSSNLLCSFVMPRLVLLLLHLLKNVLVLPLNKIKFCICIHLYSPIVTVFLNGSKLGLIFHSFFTKRCVGTRKKAAQHVHIGKKPHDFRCYSCGMATNRIHIRLRITYKSDFNLIGNTAFLCPQNPENIRSALN